MPTYRVVDSEGRLFDPNRKELDISDEEVIKLYKDMLTISIMDVIMFDAQRQGRLSFYMVSAGEEGIAVGSASSLTLNDVIFAQYREAGVLQQRGFTLDEFMNQLFANCKDYGHGRNMPVHYGSSKLKVHTISSPLSTQIPQAAGAAYALKLRHSSSSSSSSTANALPSSPSPTPPAVVACYFGEGAASEGDFHAGLNFSATRSCPVLWIVRNNGYAISTPTLEQYRGDGIASRGQGYGIDTVRVDGNDMFAVREVVEEARKLALGEEGQCKPVLIEAMSYRISHHSTSDDSFAYRARVEVEDWKRRDNPISRVRKYLENCGAWSEDLEQKERSEIRKKVLGAFKRAEAEKKPRLGKLWEGVYEELTEEQRGQIREMRDLVERYPAEYDVDAYEEGLQGLRE